MAIPYNFSGYVELNPPDNALPFYLVSLNGFPAAFWEAAQSDGDDVRASDQSNRELAVHRINWTNNGSSGSGLIAVKKPIKVDGFTRIRIWVGDSSATLPAVDATYGQYAVYPSSVRGFYPAGSGTDATSYQNNLNANGSVSGGGQTGPIAGSSATLFDGTDDYYTASTATKPSAPPLTILASAYPANATAQMTAALISDIGNANDYFALDLRGDQTSDPVRFTARRSTVADADSNGFIANAWNNLAAVASSTTSRTSYLNGVAGTANTTEIIPTGLDNLSIGALVRSTVAAYYSGRLSCVLFASTNWTATEVDLWNDMLTDQATFYGTPTWTSSSVTPPTAWPEFELLGSKIDETTLGYAMAFPRLVRNDDLRANLPNLPATKYSLLFSTDHSQVGTGRMWRADFDDPEDSWTINEVYSHTNQREMYAPAYDPVNNRIIVQCHDDTSNAATYNNQHAVLLSTTDLENFTEIDSDLYPYGNHTGYGKQIYDADREQWAFLHGLVGGQYNWWGTSYSGTDLSPALAGMMPISPSHLLGHSVAAYPGSQIVQYDDGEWYMMTWACPQSWLTQESKTHAIAIPMYWQWGEVPKYTDGYYELFTKPSDTEAFDYAPFEQPCAEKIDGTWYLFCGARDGDGENRLLLYKETATPAEWVPPLVSVAAKGRPQNPGPETTVFDWDAANDAVPAGITIAAISGTNGSSQSAGNYYELATGSGSSQQVTLQIDETFDPAAHEVVEFTVYDFKLKATLANGETAQIAINDNWTTGRDGIVFATSSLYDGVGVYPFVNNTAANAHDSYVMGVFDPTDVAGYTRTFGVDITLRLQDYGTKLLILIDGQVTYYRDLAQDGLTWNASSFAGLMIFSASTPWDQNYMRFSRLKLSTFNEVSRDLSLSAGQGIVRKANARVDAGVETFITSHS